MFFRVTLHRLYKTNKYEKNIKKVLFGIMLSLPLQGFANEPLPVIDSTLVKIDLNLSTIDPTLPSIGFPRTPAQIPDVYLDKDNAKVYFEDPCYECILELVVPGTEAVAYTYSIPDGDNMVVLPEWLSGQYELHIHRGNFCFWRLIEL